MLSFKKGIFVLFTFSVPWIGGISEPRKSVWTLKGFGLDGQVGWIQPYIVPART